MQPLLAIILLLSHSAPPDIYQVAIMDKYLELYTEEFTRICTTQSPPSRILQMRSGGKYTNNKTKGKKLPLDVSVLCPLWNVREEVIAFNHFGSLD